MASIGSSLFRLSSFKMWLFQAPAKEVKRKSAEYIEILFSIPPWIGDTAWIVGISEAGRLCIIDYANSAMAREAGAFRTCCFISHFSNFHMAHMVPTSRLCQAGPLSSPWHFEHPAGSVS